MPGGSGTHREPRVQWEITNGVGVVVLSEYSAGALISLWSKGEHRLVFLRT